jgi:hypothetical protein
MDKMIAAIINITVEMLSVLKEEKFDEFEELLSKRQELMVSVDKWKSLHPEHEYTESDKKGFKDILLLDQQITSLVENEKVKTENLLNLQKNKKQVSKKYQPYSKQTNGVFIDKSK